MAIDAFLMDFLLLYAGFLSVYCIKIRATHVMQLLSINFELNLDFNLTFLFNHLSLLITQLICAIYILLAIFPSFNSHYTWRSNLFLLNFIELGHNCSFFTGRILAIYPHVK